MRPHFRAAVAGAIGVLALFALNASQALGTHGQCGAVLTADTVLDSDLDCSDWPGPGLVIGAAGITLDLNGHVLRDHAGVVNSGFDDVTIRNGQIRGGGAGVVLTDADRNALRDLLIAGRFVGLDRASGPIWLERSNQTRIERNQLFGWGEALTLIQSSRSLIAGNRTGYYLCELEQRCTNHATGGSVGLVQSDENWFQFNRFSQGIVRAEQNSDRNVFFGNVFGYSIATGLSLGAGLFRGGGVDNVVAYNVAFNNRASGIGVADGTRTRISHNLAFGNDLVGIAVYEESATVASNLTFSNDDSGIEVGRPGTLVKRNRSNNNYDWGIQAVPGVIDGGGNRASGNRTGQCLNVTCRH